MHTKTQADFSMSTTKTLKTNKNWTFDANNYMWIWTICINDFESISHKVVSCECLMTVLCTRNYLSWSKGLFNGDFIPNYLCATFVPYLIPTLITPCNASKETTYMLFNSFKWAFSWASSETREEYKVCNNSLDWPRTKVRSFRQLVSNARWCLNRKTEIQFFMWNGCVWV